MKITGAILCGTIALTSCSPKTVDIDSQVDELYSKMPQEERIAQLKSCYMDYNTPA